jgi:hypothetical protein
MHVGRYPRTICTYSQASEFIGSAVTLYYYCYELISRLLARSPARHSRAPDHRVRIAKEHRAAPVLHLCCWLLGDVRVRRTDYSMFVHGNPEPDRDRVFGVALLPGCAWC